MLVRRFVAWPMLVLAISGCFGSGAGPKLSPGEAPGFAPTGIVAEKAEIDVGGKSGLVHWANVTWKGPLDLGQPFRVTIPEGVTRVDATFTRAATTAARISLANAATGRPRCQPEFVSAWNTEIRGVGRCSGLTVVDLMPVTWRTPLTFTRLLEGEVLQLRLVAEALDGQAGLLHLDALSMPHLKERTTEIMEVASSLDGSKLHVEVTRPDTTDPVPTILVSSPYNQATRFAGLRPENATIGDWVPRGYAVVSADVRGFGESEGCVDVWGRFEQQDQVDLVEWIAKQPWSDGKVAVYGQSYVGTTPVEAASLAAPHLVTIITVAPVINAYEDWHFGGVPNGEDTGSPFFYQLQDTQAWLGLTQSELLSMDPPNGAAALVRSIQQAARGHCNTDLLSRSLVHDPHGVYDAFYAERDFKAKVKSVKASVFYTQGFYDTNVKSQMIPGWFDRLEVPKKGLFGDWVHQHPPRADQELLFHAWFDQWLKGRDTGILETPVVEIKTNVDTVRAASTWPPTDAVEARFALDLASGELRNGTQGTGTASYLASPSPTTLPSAGPSPPSILTFTSVPVQDRLYLAGQMYLDLRATLQGVDNTFFYAALRDVAPDDSKVLISFGMLNAGLRDGYETYKPVPAGQAIDYHVPFLVTEYVVRPGHRLELEVRAADTGDWSDVAPTQPGVVTLSAGASTALRLPTLPNPGDVPAPGSAFPSLNAT